MRVFWEAEEPPTWYEGVVREFDPVSMLHMVLYDDGDVRRHDFNCANFLWEYADGHQPPIQEPKAPTGEVSACVYVCKFPGCGKRLTSRDCARKHCRATHSEWLSGLPLGNPSLPAM